MSGLLVDEGSNKLLFHSSVFAVLASYKALHRTRLAVFSGDQVALQAGRDKINEQYAKNKTLQDEEEIAKLVQGAEEASEFIRKSVVQAQLNPEKEVYQVKLKEESVRQANHPYLKEGDIPLGTKKVRRSKRRPDPTP
ncbi:hypothetical protein CAPTEDRAFT_225664 [Capitella teleta]|uniref:Uncharacterized protein n=1 Tax=Capitella teleta TaxID=283909 RepID=R7UFC1_CAPTE|nr:hypothetical protein CAPTEDRAFT_225664 [Capitella teleta]|eukprot:ELU05239.1 hypothetical protein CAPTEDRAFT_225664 [Capitella teleta]